MALCGALCRWFDWRSPSKAQRWITKGMAAGCEEGEVDAVKEVPVSRHRVIGRRGQLSQALAQGDVAPAAVQRAVSPTRLASPTRCRVTIATLVEKALVWLPRQCETLIDAN